MLPIIIVAVPMQRCNYYMYSIMLITEANLVSRGLSYTTLSNYVHL